MHAAAAALARRLPPPGCCTSNACVSAGSAGQHHGLAPVCALRTPRDRLDRRCDGQDPRPCQRRAQRPPRALPPRPHPGAARAHRAVRQGVQAACTAGCGAGLRGGDGEPGVCGVRHAARRERRAAARTAARRGAGGPASDRQLDSVEPGAVSGHLVRGAGAGAGAATVR